jgi:hypothetical protein
MGWPAASFTRSRAHALFRPVAERQRARPCGECPSCLEVVTAPGPGITYGRLECWLQVRMRSSLRSREVDLRCIEEWLFAGGAVSSRGSALIMASRVYHQLCAWHRPDSACFGRVACTSCQCPWGEAPAPECLRAGIAQQWQKCMGVEPTRDRSSDRAAVLKTVRPTGTRTPPL